ncbi:MAG: hypothetical protein CLLPBCKN_001764 [Chroococcidiopsis cubana SAG 39.79]|uniref:DUF2254 domain-containing protein n=2 Tax=Chroococcidiopsis TaxID=54298 RepID=A0AB37UIU6_9CYAN|nr:hypothetical protein [Chroococcidiopsis cubana SAG 39.79]PSB65926.1 DUF2254 domain-containing protein [Chroococcidiopsis cubana CCALA 043]RUT11306.1 hypothetical protein DSM107010_34470 [Chroococcidiopsis cubana SAG 39.79]
MLTLDREGYYGPLESWGWIYVGSTDGAREVLSAVSGSMITVAATAFSITIVALQLAAANFGPRLLRNFMQDTGNQVVLGTFIATFIYCLLVLRTIRGDGDDYDRFIPQISITVATGLALVSIGMLIYFIHHASTIIQASHVISEAGADLDRAVDRLFPEHIGVNQPEFKQPLTEIPDNFDTEACKIKANNSGYVQAIDDEELMKIACRERLLLRINYRPGKFVVKDQALVTAYPPERVNRQLTNKINDAFILGKQRTEQQDVEFPINQLVEITLRAISPSVNDPFTAIRCIDQLSAGLSRLVQRQFPSPYRYDERHELRVIAEPVTFEGLVDAAFNQIRQYGKQDVAVIIRLLEAIATIADYTCDRKDRAVLLRHAAAIKRDSYENVSDKLDKQDIDEQYLVVEKSLRSG